jgi:hypothetical protein
MEKQNKALHFSLQLTLNEDANWDYRSPKVNSNINFSLPVQLVDSTAIGKWIAQTVKEMEADWAEAVEEHEAEQAEIEREKKEKEASGLKPIDIDALLSK